MIARELVPLTQGSLIVRCMQASQASDIETSNPDGMVPFRHYSHTSSDHSYYRRGLIAETRNSDQLLQISAN